MFKINPFQCPAEESYLFCEALAMICIFFCAFQIERRLGFVFEEISNGRNRVKRGTVG